MCGLSKGINHGNDDIDIIEAEMQERGNYVIYRKRMGFTNLYSKMDNT